MIKSVILAAGKGTRMKSESPKVIHKVKGREMINRVLDFTKEAGIEEDIVVVGYKADEVKSAIDREVTYTYQDELLGTAHATKTALPHIDDEDTVIVLFGDVPLLRAKTIRDAIDNHIKKDMDLTIFTVILEDTKQYGKIIRDESGNILTILEAKEERYAENAHIKEINVGVMIFKATCLKECLNRIDNNNIAKEYYIVDAVRISNELGLKLDSYVVEDKRETEAANTKEELAQLEELYEDMNKEG